VVQIFFLIAETYGTGYALFSLSLPVQHDKQQL